FAMYNVRWTMLDVSRFLTSYITHRTSYIALYLLLTSYISNAQWYDPEKVNAKANSIYVEAINNARNEKYSVAIEQINEALKIDPKLVDAYLSMGGIYANLKNYDESVTNFEKAFSLDSVY